jgi:hypothetical protein
MLFNISFVQSPACCRQDATMAPSRVHPVYVGEKNRNKWESPVARCLGPITYKGVIKCDNGDRAFWGVQYTKSRLPDIFAWLVITDETILTQWQEI